MWWKRLLFVCRYVESEGTANKPTICAYCDEQCHGSCSGEVRTLSQFPKRLRLMFRFVSIRIDHKCLHKTSPTYLSSLIEVYHPRWPGLCSGSDCLHSWQFRNGILRLGIVHFTQKVPHAFGTVSLIKFISWSFKKTFRNFPVQWLIAKDQQFIPNALLILFFHLMSYQ